LANIQAYKKAMSIIFCGPCFCKKFYVWSFFCFT